MPDHIFTVEAAQTIQDQANRDYELLAWIVAADPETGEVVARPISPAEGALPCLLMGSTLADWRDQLPAGLKHSAVRSPDPPRTIEVWYADPAADF